MSAKTSSWFNFRPKKVKRQRSRRRRTKLQIQKLELRRLLTADASITHEFRYDSFEIQSTYSFHYSDITTYEDEIQGNFESTEGAVNWTSPTQGTGTLAGTATGTGSDWFQGQACSSYIIENRGSLNFTVNAETRALNVTTVNNHFAESQVTSIHPGFFTCGGPSYHIWARAFFGGREGKYVGTFDAETLMSSVSWYDSGYFVAPGGGEAKNIMPASNVTFLPNVPTDFVLEREIPQPNVTQSTGLIRYGTDSMEYVEIGKPLNFTVDVEGRPNPAVFGASETVADIKLTWKSSTDENLKSQLSISESGNSTADALGVYWNSSKVTVEINELPEPPAWADRLEIKVEPKNAELVSDSDTENSTLEFFIRNKHIHVLTHGFNPTFWDFEEFRSGWLETYPDAVFSLAETIKQRDSATTYSTKWDSSSGWTHALLFAAAWAVLPLTRPFAAAGIVDSMEEAERLAYDAAETIADDLVNNELLSESPATWQTIHLIGHSRGGAVNAYASRLLAEAGGFQVDQYTTLDGYSTDWPGISGELGDISIVDNARGDKRLNLRAQNGLGAVIGSYVDTGIGYLEEIIERYLWFYLPSLTFAEDTLRQLDWRAPNRGFNIDEEIPDSDHLNISDRYFLNSEFFPDHSPMIDSASPSASASESGNGGQSGSLGFSADGESTENFDTLFFGFVDGGFEQIADIRDQATALRDSINSDLGLALLDVLANDTFLIETTWNVEGNVGLASINGEHTAELRQTASADPAISQIVGIGSAEELQFELDVVSAGAGDRLQVWFGSQLLQEIDLTNPGSSPQSISVANLRDQVDPFRFVVVGPSEMPAVVRVDQFRVVADLSFDRLVVDPVHIIPGENATLRAERLNDPTPNGVTVEFYQETNGSPGLQIGSSGDMLLGLGQTKAESWEYAFTASNQDLGAIRIYAQAVDGEGMRGPIAQKQLIVGPQPNRWQNPSNHFDVNQDDRVSTVDALVIINGLSRFGGQRVLGIDSDPPPFFDVNGDGSISALDALLVINQLARTSNSSGEGELTDVAIQEWSRDLTPISVANQTSDPLTLNGNSPSQRPSFSREVDGYVASAQVVDAEYESIGSESLKTLDESLVSLLTE